mmetsp:Transcript_29994/g.84626  ORF Transcript_29994/g.84626 Transcript_29994/m.84626 type:complete len:1013 (+) Transcript_29994:261-3299(+)|eukprot:CAMPEP_0117653028 /NCGR_PEP_ID=MMETSP0804-20121206/2967_1 /TAXON_ID=1074897 /ORGANISM="Tetraselmis astigmatica, Strain CCMP880" /LENGTH=1012 /DNA_ID=CAMNT_0005459165 /DNA_START=258 /DNA_END=3296 /DNA_ORIENTATION=+
MGLTCLRLWRFCQLLLVCLALQELDVMASLWSNPSSKWGVQDVTASPKTVKPSESEGSHAMFEEGLWHLGQWRTAESELRRLQEASKTAPSKLGLVESYNLANYLNLRPVRALHMPIPVHIIFIGFEGDGNLGVQLSSEEVSQWFDHLDHLIPHSYIPESQLACREDGLCNTWHHPSAGAIHSRVHYNISCQAVELGGQETEVFERAIRLFTRPVDPRHPSGPQQVDADRMEEFVSGFLHSLGLDMSYSVVVLNPKWDPSRAKYGYRAGLSSAEAAFLSAEADVQAAAAKQPVHTQTGSRRGWAAAADPEGWTWQKWGPAAPKFGVQEKHFETAVWVEEAAEELDTYEQQRESLADLLPTERRTGDGAEAARVNFLERVALAGATDREQLLKSATSGELSSPEGCLVNTWTGHGRWVMVDLTAGEGDWGPGSPPGGASSSPARHSLPSLEAFFPLGGSSMGGAGGLDAAATVVRRSRSLLAPPEYEEGGSSEEVFILQAELDLLDYRLDKYCGEGTAGDAHCGSGRSYRARVEQQLQSAVAHAKAGQSLDSAEVAKRLRDLQTSLFGEPATWRAGYGSGSVRQRSQDLFLAQMGSVLSSAVRHVVVPPTSTWHSGDAVWHAEDEVRLPTKLQVTVYLVNDLSILAKGRKGKATAGPLDGEFNVSALRTELNTLALPGQQLSVTTHVLPLADDPALAAGVAASLRAGALSGTGEPMRSLDSALLHRQICHSVAPEPHSRHSNTNAAVPTRDIPLFVFQVQREVLTVIDEHLLAKSLPDMVLVVHNLGNVSAGPNPAGLLCSGQVVQRGALSSLQAAVQAVARHLAGALPAHIGFSPVHDAVTHDWMWSVGAHAMSMTSPGWQLSQATRDTVFRSYALRVLDASLHASNAIIHRLSQEEVRGGVAFDTHAGPLSNKFIKAYTALVEDWMEAMRGAQILDFSSMFNVLGQVEAHTRELEAVADEMVDALHPGKCTQHRQLHLPPSLQVAMLGGVAAAATTAWRAWSQRANKPKVN